VLDDEAADRWFDDDDDDDDNDGRDPCLLSVRIMTIESFFSWSFPNFSSFILFYPCLLSIRIKIKDFFSSLSFQLPPLHFLLAFFP
jgi:hypothetical protein